MSTSTTDHLGPVALATEEAPLVINLVPEDEYRAKSYGIPLVGETQHRMIGRGLHNPRSFHKLQVWDNSRRPCKIEGGFHGPHHGANAADHTTERYTFLWSAQATVITAHPSMRDQHPEGDALFIGAYVDLQIQGFSLGVFRVEARPLHDPHLTRVR